MKILAKTYDTLVHNVDKVRQRRIKEERKEVREMETLFRKALQRQWPNHKLAFHTTDLAKTATEGELPLATTQEIHEILHGEAIPERYPDIFYTKQQIIMWLPDDKLSYNNFIKHIPKLLAISDNPIYCIATKTFDNTAAGTMAYMDLLDESKPHWWQHPPDELAQLTPVHPPIRILKQNAEGASREMEQHAFILTFQFGTANINGNVPDLMNPWYWMAHPDHIIPRMASKFIIDTTTVGADAMQTWLQASNNTTINKCTWSHKINTRRPGLAHRVTFEGTPIEEMESYIEREIYVKQLKEWCSTTPEAYVGDHLARKHPHALYATTTSDEVWQGVPRNLVTNLILLNSRLAIIHTEANASEWSAWMTAQEEADATSKITRINWKTSTMGGGLWATPSSITTQRQQWFTGNTTEEREHEDDQQAQLIAHIPDHRQTTSEEM
jgi:hypothetical protein